MSSFTYSLKHFRTRLSVDIRASSCKVRRILMVKMHRPTSQRLHDHRRCATSMFSRSRYIKPLCKTLAFVASLDSCTFRTFICITASEHQ
jgi:hypothetical protein